ncbi:uncharacterized protein SPSK_04650 [Sporothrix schenckii 1099-18]|uniref:Uncharacterized protein n=1 Tax=Sporothrix schenckii 1099-18 TaxID=1397361 RepID=A0A0F2LZF5_SPOSC|nr:uncharacterized protein SPSK_04650 [Sporothrix schenckii 1099-18]KJR82847.1 hypothetical protein SPSK_04650 [Sporothrix schenckii 1099-18]
MKERERKDAVEKTRSMAAGNTMSGCRCVAVVRKRANTRQEAMGADQERGKDVPNEETGKVGTVGGLKAAGELRSTNTARAGLDTLVYYGDQGQKKNGKHAKQHAGEGRGEKC